MDPAHAFRLQADSCARMEAPIYAELLEWACSDIDDGGVLSSVIDAWEGDPVAGALPLRLMGSIHRLVMNGAADQLALHYPSVGGTPAPGLVDAFARTIEQNVDQIRADIEHPVQTNEPGRTAVLLGGLLELAGIVDMPMSLTEIGASAGLHLHVDRYHYSLGQAQWGDPNSGVTVVSDWRGQIPDVSRHLSIDERSGADLNPIDVTSPSGARWLESFVWTDHVDRLERLRRAIAVANQAPVNVEAIDAVAAVERMHPREGMVTTLIHSVLTQYLDPAGRAAFAEGVRALAAAATDEAPVAWLRFEPGQSAFELRLSVAPLGIDLVLAEAQPHGGWVNWLTR